MSSAQFGNGARNTTHMLVAIGNEFSMNVHRKPLWLSSEETGATQLFILFPSAWQRTLIKTTVSAAVLVVSVGVWWRGTRLPVSLLMRTLFIWRGTENMFVSRDPLVPLLWLSIRFTAVLSVLCISFLPLYVMASNRYQCGEMLARLSLAYTANSPLLELAIAVLTCVFEVCVSLGVAWLYGLGRVAYVRRGVAVTRAPSTHWFNYHHFSRTFTEPMIPEAQQAQAQTQTQTQPQQEQPQTVAATPDDSQPAHAYQHSRPVSLTSASSRRLLSPSPSMTRQSPSPSPSSSPTPSVRSPSSSSLLSPTSATRPVPSSPVLQVCRVPLHSRFMPIANRALRIAAGTTVWVIVMLIMSVPTMLYEILDSLPDDNVFELNGYMITLVQALAVPLLVLSSGFIVPLLAAKVILVSFGDTMSLISQRKASTRLVLITRLVLWVIVPVAVVIVMDNGCLQWWKYLWRPCSDPTNQTFRKPFHFTDRVTSMKLKAFTSQDICKPVYDADKAMCARRVVEVVSPLMISNMMLQATLFPSFILVWHAWLRPHIRAKLFPLHTNTNANTKSAQTEQSGQTHVVANGGSEMNGVSVYSGEKHVDTITEADTLITDASNNENPNCKNTSDADACSGDTTTTNNTTHPTTANNTTVKDNTVQPKTARFAKFSSQSQVDATASRSPFMKAILTRILSPPQLDNFGLVVVTWVEVGIVYGCLAPLVLFAVLFTLLTHLAAYKLLTTALTAAVTSPPSSLSPSARIRSKFRHSFPPSSLCPPLAYLVLSVIVQCAIVTWFYVSTRLHGWQLVAVVAPVSCVCLCLHMLTRVGERWVVVLIAGVIVRVWNAICEVCLWLAERVCGLVCCKVLINTQGVSERLSSYSHRSDLDPHEDLTLNSAI